jgi:hypothetical protein
MYSSADEYTSEEDYDNGNYDSDYHHEGQEEDNQQQEQEVSQEEQDSEYYLNVPVAHNKYPFELRFILEGTIPEQIIEYFKIAIEQLVDTDEFENFANKASYYDKTCSFNNIRRCVTKTKLDNKVDKDIETTLSVLNDYTKNHLEKLSGYYQELISILEGSDSNWNMRNVSIAIDVCTDLWNENSKLCRHTIKYEFIAIVFGKPLFGGAWDLTLTPSDFGLHKYEY